MQTFLDILSFIASSGKSVTISTLDQCKRGSGWTYGPAQKTVLSIPRRVQLWRTKHPSWSHHLATQQCPVQRQQPTKFGVLR